MAKSRAVWPEGQGKAGKPAAVCCGSGARSPGRSAQERSCPLFWQKTADSKKLKAFLGISALLPSPDCSRPPRCPSTPTKLHVGLWAALLGREAKRKACQPLEGLDSVLGTRPIVGDRASCPTQASTTLWWQECGRHGEGTGGPLAARSPAEATLGQTQRQ